MGISTTSKNRPAGRESGVNVHEEIQFTITPEHVKASTVPIGITVPFAGARPAISINKKWSPRKAPGMSAQPRSRSMTIGTWRGNNTTFSYDIPASALVAGVNTLTFSPLSGSGGAGFLGPGYSIDCIDFTQSDEKTASSTSGEANSR